jgi:hypothetical protein
MKRINKYIPLVFIFTAIIFSSCFLWDPVPVLFRIQIDSVNVPTSLTTNDTLVIKLYGYIGNDTCYWFHHFQSVKEDHSLQLAVWGIHNVAYRKGCPGSQVYLNGQQYRVYPLLSGVFEISVQQPDGMWLKKSVTVN